MNDSHLGRRKASRVLIRAPARSEPVVLTSPVYSGTQLTKVIPVLIQHSGTQLTKATPVLIQHDGTQLTNTHHLQVTSQPHPLSTLKASNLNNPLALHLQVQPILDGIRIPEMAIFGSTSDPTGHVVNYNIHMDLRTTSEGLKCKAFSATLEE
ncbi:hypothetical protein ACLOJK_034413 [Asimina triloba]